MYSDASDITNPDFLLNSAAFITGVRAFFPILAGYLALLIILPFWRIERAVSEQSNLGWPLRSVFIYGLIGLSFFFLSPDPPVALYWAAMYLSVPLVIWAVLNQAKEDERLKLLIHINWIIAIFLAFFFLIGPLKPILLGAANPRIFELPFGV